MINSLKVLHDAGYVYNDVKLDNIMTGFNENLPKTYTEGNCLEGVDLFLIDYGFATAYKDKTTGMVFF